MSTAVAVHASKKKRKKPQPRFFRIASRISDQMEAKVAAAFADAVRRVQAGVDPRVLEAAIVSGNMSVIESAAGSGRIQAVLLGDSKLMQSLKTTSTMTGEAGTDVLKDVTGLDATFNAAHPNVTLFAREQTANLVVQVGDDVKETIRIVTALGNEIGLTPQQQAAAIRGAIGLPPNWAGAPTAFGEELRNAIVNAGRLHNDPFVKLPRSRRAMQKKVVAELRAGVKAGKHLDPAWVAQMQAKYERNLINRRAMNIARTETLRAAHYGQREGWKQAVQQGVLPQNLKRFWIVTPDDRLSLNHAQIPGMNPDGRGLDEPFRTPEGDFMDPPTRTNCRCGTALLFPGRSGLL